MITQEMLDILLANCMKPEAINGKAEERIKRIQELVLWFLRLAECKANPKWLKGHAFELIYHIAKTDPYLDIDLEQLSHDAFKEGLMVPEDSLLKMRVKEGKL